MYSSIGLRLRRVPTSNLAISNNYIEKRGGSELKSTKDEYPTGGGVCQKRGGSEFIIVNKL